MKALVVDGDPARRALAVDLLGRGGHEAVAALDPDDAWEIVADGGVALVLLGADGPALALCRRIRSLPDGDRPVVLALTGSLDSRDLAAALDAGADDCVAAPLDPAALEARVAVAERRIAALAAQGRAVEERDRLLDVAQAARLEAEAARQRFAFLAEASTVLASSLDYDTTLANVARLAVPLVADYCIFDVMEDGQEHPRQVAVVHIDPSREEMLREMRRRYPPRSTGPNPGTRAIATGQAVLVPRIPPTLLGELAQDEAQAEMLRSLGVQSYMGVPVIARGRTIGSITLVATDSGRAYGPEDLRLAEDLARRAAVAVDNARLYYEAQRASERLRALAWAATEAQTAPDEQGVFEVIDAAIVRSGLNVHASLLERDADGIPTLLVQHVAFTDKLLPVVERLLGRPIVGIRMDPVGVAPFRTAVEERRVAIVRDAAGWLRETLPWLTERAARIVGGLRQVGQGMAVPITDGREVLGVLTIWGESLGEADLAAMELLGRQAGGALAGLRHRAVERERHRLDGAMLLARTAAHAINNALGLTSGYAELLAGHPAVTSNPELSRYAEAVLEGARQAAERLLRFQHVIRLEETPSPLGEDRPVLDMDRSTAPTSR